MAYTEWKAPDKVVLLSGGNPQIPKRYGQAPIDARIAAAPGWKGSVARRIDQLITDAVPGVRKAAKCNSPLYGLEDDHYFLGYHCFDKYLKVTFMQGASIEAQPPGPSKQKAVHYLDIYENDELNEVQFIDWLRQACRLPGEKM